MTGRISSPQWSDLRVLLWFFGYVLIAENVLVIIWACTAGGKLGWPSVQALQIYGTAMLCSGAASFTGGLLGFLFGIPRTGAIRTQSTTISPNHTAITASTEPAATQVPREGGGWSSPVSDSNLRPNTNLEDISDGLTKALLGIGLSQIYKVGDGVREVARILEPAFGQGVAAKIVGLSVLVYGGFAGFFFGYLVTRIFLTGAFGRAEETAKRQ